MKTLSKWSKKFISQIVIIAMMITMLSGTVFSASLTIPDGNAYFYFSSGGLDADVSKSGFSINGAEVIYITSKFAAHTEKIDKALLNAKAVNTITIFTGNSNGIIDETLSREEAGNKCDEFGITSNTLRLILPDGTIVNPSKIIAYKPIDADTPLNEGHTTTSITSGQVSIGDNSLDYAYKLEIQFDLTNIQWDPQNDMESQTPAIKNVSLQIGAVPSERNIVWYSKSNADGVVQLALKSDMTGNEFPASCTSFEASANETGFTGYISYKATMTDLAENTQYVYRVGNDTDGWSDIYDFKTQSFSGNFSFLAVSDPQLGQGARFSDIQGEIDGWQNTLDKAKANFFDTTAFLACMGDQIADAEIDGQYDALFAPDALKSFSFAAVPGNHDVGATYTPHYNMPNVSELGVSATMGDGSGNYYFTYGDALFMTLNLMSSAHDEHIKFLEDTIEANPNAKWKFVMMHYSIYGSTAQGDTTQKIVEHRQKLAPVFSRLGVDVVFQGHEHAYARSYMMNSYTPNTLTGGSSVTQPDPSEVLYLTLNSASGSDYVTTQSENLSHLAKKDQQLTPNVSKVDLTDSSFSITSYYTDDMTVVDSFTINRNDVPTVKSVHVSPKNATVKMGLSQQFTATALGYSNPSQDVVWSISGNESALTTISPAGVLSVDSDETAKSLVVTATSAENDSKYASVEVALESNITSINVGHGEAYTLPAAIDNVSVTQWTNASGSVVTKADTSLPGYRYYKATLSDGTTAKYRVNVGEFVTKYENLLADFDVDCVDNTATKQQQITKGDGWLVVAAADPDGVQVVNYDASTKALKYGPDATSYSSFIGPQTAFSGSYSISMKMKLEDITLPESSDTNHVTLRLGNNGNTELLSILVYVQPSGKIVFQPYSGSNTAHNVSKTYINVDIDSNGDSPWFDVKFDVYENLTWSCAVNDTYLFTDKALFYSDTSKYSTIKLNRVVMSDKEASQGVAYYSDIEVKNLRHFTGDLPKAVNACVSQGVSSEQTTTASLTMSDGKTKDFAVRYTVDTSTTGAKNVVGTIEGFDDTITVMVSVENIIKDINQTAAGIEKVTLRKVDNVTSGIAAFAYYDNSHKLYEVKFVPFTKNDFTNGEAVLNVGLVFPSVVTEGYVKGYIFDSSSSLAPLDFVFTPEA